jgi:hypothetical protein
VPRAGPSIHPTFVVRFRACLGVSILIWTVDPSMQQARTVRACSVVCMGVAPVWGVRCMPNSVAGFFEGLGPRPAPGLPIQSPPDSISAGQ